MDIFKVYERVSNDHLNRWEQQIKGLNRKTQIKTEHTKMWETLCISIYKDKDVHIFMYCILVRNIFKICVWILDTFIIPTDSYYHYL